MKREETTELVRERFLLCRERIGSIPEETVVYRMTFTYGCSAMNLRRRCMVNLCVLG